MQTQRDHVHAHTFMVGRLSSALVEGDPTRAEIPGRRAQTGLLSGIVLVLLVAGGFAVYGWIVPGGSKAFRQAGAIVVEKETGSRMVYVEGVLHPVPDLTSAMLIKGPSSQVKLISRNSLKDVPRGVPLGVPGAPETVPAAQSLVSGPWLVCLPSREAPPGSNLGGPEVGVNLDPGPAGDSLPPAQFAVARDPDGVAYLLVNHVKHRVEDESVLVALGAAGIEPPRAPAMWLSWLPDGVPLAPAKIPGAGDDGPEVGGTAYPVGTLFRQRAQSGSEQLFVLRRDGLAPVSRTEFLLADAKRRGEPVDLAPADVVDAPRSSDRSLLTRLPDLASLKLADAAGRALCVRQRPVSADAVSSEVVHVSGWESAVNDAGQTYVVARPGSGMLVTPVPAQRTGVPPTSLISDAGTAYRLVAAETVAALKLSGARPVPFPKDLLAALPQGPALSRQAVTSLPRG